MNFFQLFIILVFLFFQSTVLYLPQEKPVLLMNATAHLGDGRKIDNAAVAFQDDRITLVGDATRIRLDMSAFQVKKVYGKHIYAAVLADKNNLSVKDSLYSIRLDAEELVVDLSRPALEEGKEATLVVTDQAISEKGKATVAMAFVKGKEASLKKRHLRLIK